MIFPSFRDNNSAELMTTGTPIIMTYIHLNIDM
jgi:hypothetical protein